MRAKLKRWFWCACLTGEYESSSATLAERDAPVLRARLADGPELPASVNSTGRRSAGEPSQLGGGGCTARPSRSRCPGAHGTSTPAHRSPPRRSMRTTSRTTTCSRVASWRTSGAATRSDSALNRAPGCDGCAPPGPKCRQRGV